VNFIRITTFLIECRGHAAFKAYLEKNKLKVILCKVNYYF